MRKCNLATKKAKCLYCNSFVVCLIVTVLQYKLLRLCTQKFNIMQIKHIHTSTSCTDSHTHKHTHTDISKLRVL